MMGRMAADLAPAFLDTAYLYALLNSRDEWHAVALRWQERLAEERRLLVTTEFVLVEFADGLASLRYRSEAARAIAALRSSDLVEIVPASSALFLQALSLFEQRDDKGWGMTDCTSFTVMSDHGLTDALTVDEHFRQAGFNPLLLEPLAT